ncbi:tRNA-specific adenosine deaminase [Halobacillus andaensis]|uniref:tRNA-specific adenosine deaminase n=1 Tax=Halobacillus andaensis TaxID=1176239 RepID=A0A917B2L8_HALAA|nr:nucleoside deaminase [Halobacillus andaensis]MBP2004793.1 tRNA(Arg) A34 adenosine deaminase TadA [Halobacillus andaensis]GGF18839.1 tRNA-specific adenosine deaminase [Halobacillus andaensis]
MVKNGEVISEGVNELHKTYDISGHAELIAIRNAQTQLQTHDLSGCHMYASGQPCPMCLTAMYFSGIHNVYFAESIDDAEAVGLGLSKQVYEDLKKPNEQRSLVMKQVPLEISQRSVMKLWKEGEEQSQ